ncbi:MAG TPA: surface-adhesin E family protein [Longimicrobium sp.]|nr:surface-adhesin E family protein [Longimicrobium sp.]
MEHVNSRSGWMMPPRMNRIAVALAAVAALVAPASASAQRVAVAAAPWRAQRPAVVAGLQQMGFQPEPDTAGEPGLAIATFRAGDTRVAAIFGPSGLAMLNTLYLLPPDQARRRFGELRDSLVRVLGQPDSAGPEPMWVRRDGRVRLFVRPDSGGLASAAVLNRASPTYVSELRSAYQAVVVRNARQQWQPWVAARVDTLWWRPLHVRDSLALNFVRTSVERTAQGAWRVAVRWDWLTPQGEGRATYDTMVHETEVDCDQGTYRTGRVSWFLRRDMVEGIKPRWREWQRPVPTSAGDVIVREFCAYARGLP